MVYSSKKMFLIPIRSSLFTDKLQNSVPALNAVVNNAAIQVSKPILETTVEEWDKTICYKFTPNFCRGSLCSSYVVKEWACCNRQCFFRSCRANFCSIAAYAASKGGILALTRAMAIEFAKDNIRVNAVLPGAVDTPMLRDGMNRGHATGPTITERLDNLARKTVNGRIGKPSEIAHAIYFFG